MPEHKIHADDEMGKAAHAAAMLAHLFQYRLLAAASSSLPREKRAQELKAALAQWPAIARAMSALEAAAPTIARQAQAEADRIRDISERHPTPQEAST